VAAVPFPSAAAASSSAFAAPGAAAHLAHLGGMLSPHAYGRQGGFPSHGPLTAVDESPQQQPAARHGSSRGSAGPLSGEGSVLFGPHAPAGPSPAAAERHAASPGDSELLPAPRPPLPRAALPSHRMSGSGWFGPVRPGGSLSMDGRAHAGAGASPLQPQSPHGHAALAYGQPAPRRSNLGAAPPRAASTTALVSACTARSVAPREGRRMLQHAGSTRSHAPTEDDSAESLAKLGGTDGGEAADKACGLVIGEADEPEHGAERLPADGWEAQRTAAWIEGPMRLASPACGPRSEQLKSALAYGGVGAMSRLGRVSSRMQPRSSLPGF
jgi:hypothetical protein